MLYQSVGGQNKSSCSLHSADPNHPPPHTQNVIQIAKLLNNTKLKISGFNSAWMMGSATVQAGSRPALTVEIRVQCEEAGVEFMVDKVALRLVAPWDLRFSPSAPVRQFTISPVHQFASSPVHQFASSPVHHFASSPVHQFTRSPVHQFAISPVRQFTSSPVHQFASSPVLQTHQFSYHRSYTKCVSI
jgi:hypothetical protein